MGAETAVDGLPRAKERVVITGATGLIGSAVTRHLLQAGYPVTVFTRDPAAAAKRLPGVQDFAQWAPDLSGEWYAAIDGAWGVIHCAAPSIFDKRYTREVAEFAVANRRTSTQGLVNAMEAAGQRPAVFVNSVSQGYYGFNTVTDKAVDESSPVGTDMWGQESIPWEAAASAADALGVRTVNLRIGYVLSSEGGGLPAQIEQAQGGRGGSKPADAYRSWIHIEDLARLYLFALETEALSGPVNATAPGAVTNAQFAAEMGKVVGKELSLSPAWLARLFLGPVAEIYSRGRIVVPRKATEAGFRFEYPTLAEALADLGPKVLAKQTAAG